jgi:glycosyltransferase involved in cell wall biosynthesis
MKLSVIIPCFNAADTISVQLEALANQQWSEPWEIIVSDNGSTDETVAIVEGYKQRLPNLRIVDSSARRGAAHARNVGASFATGKALAFCDGDDEIAAGWVSTMGEALAKYDFVAGKRDYTKLNEPWILENRCLIQVDELPRYHYPPYLSHASSSTLGIKRSIHQTIGGFDESMYRLEDIDYCWRVQLVGIKLHFIPEATIHYRFRNNLVAMYQQARLAGEYNVLLYKKYSLLGMPKLSWKTGVKAWWQLLKCFPQVFSPEERARWISNFARRWGRLQGCIKYQVLAL